MDSYKIDPTQEMMALGFTNFFNSFVNGAFVVSAGMSRSTVNYQANAATQGLVFLIRHPPILFRVLNENLNSYQHG